MGNGVEVFRNYEIKYHDVLHFQHMFQPSRYDREAPGFRGRLPDNFEILPLFEKFLMKMKIWPKIKAAFARYWIIFHTVARQFTRISSAIHCTAYLMFLEFSWVN